MCIVANLCKLPEESLLQREGQGSMGGFGDAETGCA